MYKNLHFSIHNYKAKEFRVSIKIIYIAGWLRESKFFLFV